MGSDSVATTKEQKRSFIFVSVEIVAARRPKNGDRKLTTDNGQKCEMLNIIPPGIHDPTCELTSVAVTR
jgi:hypothetical protein